MGYFDVLVGESDVGGRNVYGWWMGGHVEAVMLLEGALLAMEMRGAVILVRSCRPSQSRAAEKPQVSLFKFP